MSLIIWVESRKMEFKATDIVTLIMAIIHGLVLLWTKVKQANNKYPD